MDPHISTTPFGRRPLTLAHVATQAVAKERPSDKAVHKWQVFRAICAAKSPLGVTERALAVLDALLSFHPETVLTGEGLIVFPSNQQLALRAHGMAPATLRRHLACLVDCGLIIRRDSPNGKRYCRKGQGGEIEKAFGFDLTPLVARADAFEAMAEEVRAEARALKLVKERITICRRDIAKMIATGQEEGVPFRDSEAQPRRWADIHALYRLIVERIPRTASRTDLEPIARDLSCLAAEILMTLEEHVKFKDMDGSESQNERHIQNSNSDRPIDLEPALREGWGADIETKPVKPQPLKGYPLGMVMDACPDIADWISTPIHTWRDFVRAAGLLRSVLGISPSAWEDAVDAMGEMETSVCIAAILQRSEAIKSPGGYLRALTEKARTGHFSLGPVLMALLRTKLKGHRSTAS